MRNRIGFTTMVAFVVLAILPISVSKVDASADLGNLLALTRALQNLFALGHLIVILPSTDDCLSALKGTDISAAYLPADRPEETLSEVKRQGGENRLEMVALIGVSNETLIEQLFDGASRLSHKVHSFLPIDEKRNVKNLRLDSNVYFYRPTAGGGGYEILEQFSVRSGPAFTQEVGKWSAARGLEVPKPHKWQRRTNLRGTRLITGIIEWSVFNRDLEFDKDGQIVDLRGMFPDALRYLGGRFNFTVGTVLSRDGKWGGLEEDGVTWNGMIAMLIDGEIDLCTAGLTQVMTRDAAVDFSIPMANDIATFLAPSRESPATHFWVYMEIFPISVWCLIIASVVTLGIGFYAIEILGGNRFHAVGDPEKFGLSNGLAVCALLVLQLSYNIVMDSLSSRLIFLFAGFMAYLMFTYYTCDLTARMTSGPAPSVIGSFQDAIEQQYRILLEPGTSNQEHMRGAKEGTGMYTYYNDIILADTETYFVKNLAEAFHRMRTEEKTVLFDSDLAVFGNKDFVALDISDALHGQMGWAFQKNSELTDFFDYHLFHMGEIGVLPKIIHNYTHVPNEDFGVAEAPSLGYDNTSFPFLTLAWLIFAAVGLALVERARTALVNWVYRE